MESAFEILTRFDMGQGISSPYCPHFRRNVHLGILIGRRLPILLRHAGRCFDDSTETVASTGITP